MICQHLQLLFRKSTNESITLALERGKMWSKTSNPSISTEVKKVILSQSSPLLEERTNIWSKTNNPSTSTVVKKIIQSQSLPPLQFDSKTIQEVNLNNISAPNVNETKIEVLSYECEHCPKLFTAHGLKRHLINIHTKVQQHPCTICEKNLFTCIKTSTSHRNTF